jgi:hypothetical protein
MPRSVRARRAGGAPEFSLPAPLYAALTPRQRGVSSGRFIRLAVHKRRVARAYKPG